MEVEKCFDGIVWLLYINYLKEVYDMAMCLGVMASAFHQKHKVAGSSLGIGLSKQKFG